MDLFQLNISASPIKYPFVIKAIKAFLNNNNLKIKQEHNVFLNTYPKILLEKNIAFETGYKKNEVKKICKNLPEFLKEYSIVHPDNLDLKIDLVDIKRINEFNKIKVPFIKTIKFLILACILSFATGFFLSKISFEPNLKINKQIITIERANTKEELVRGLSNRSSMPENHGMLFEFKETTQIDFWMKDMMFGLDLVYLDQNLKVVDIIKDQEPCSLSKECELIKSKEKFNYVLELNSNKTNELELKIGDEIKFRNYLIQ